MSTLFGNRAQSANPRLSRRSPSNNKASQIKQRPTTSVGTTRSHTDVYHQRTSGPFDLSIPSETKSNLRRSRSTTSRSSRNSQSPARQLQLDDIGDLLRYLEHDDPFIVKVDSLGPYHLFVESIDLRKTPLNCKLLYELQKLENRIVQTNACDDTRFRSLMDVLQHQYVTGGDQTELKDDKHKNLSVYQSVNDHIEY